MLLEFFRKSSLCISPLARRGIFRYSSATASSSTAANGEESSQKATSATAEEHEKKFIEIQDLYLRSLADMENLRNRTKREIEAAHQFAIQKFVKDLVPVADVLETAISQTTTSSSQPSENGNEAPSLIQGVVQGMEMTLQEFKKVMGNHGVSVVDPLHQKFDPNVHMALVEVDRPDLEPGTVVYVEKKGYLLNGRVIRAATVAISKK